MKHKTKETINAIGITLGVFATFGTLVAIGNAIETAHGNGFMGWFLSLAVVGFFLLGLVQYSNNQQRVKVSYEDD